MKPLGVAVLAAALLSAAVPAGFGQGDDGRGMQELLDRGNRSLEAGDYQDALAACLEGRRLALKGGHDAAAATFENCLGSVYDSVGRREEAVVYYEKSLETSLALDDKLAISNVLGNLGSVYEALGEHDRAVASLEEALEIRKKLGDQPAVAQILNNLGTVHASSGDYAKAVRYHEQSMEIRRGLHDTAGFGASLGNLGDAYFSLGDYPKAVAYAEKSLDIFRKLGRKHFMAKALTNLGRAYDALGDHTRGISLYEESLKIEKELGDLAGAALSFNNLGVARESLNDYPKAIALHEASLGLCRELKDGVGQARSLNNLGKIHLALGDHPKAISNHEESLGLARRLGNPPLIAMGLANLGNLYASIGDYAKAASSFEGSLKISRDAGDKAGVAKVLNNLGVLHEFRGEYAKAVARYQESVKLCRELGVPAGTQELNIAYARIQMGDLAAAEAALAKLHEPWRLLGVLHLAKGEPEKASEFFAKSLDEDRVSRTADLLFADYCGLGHAGMGLGRAEEAIGHYEKAVALSEDIRETLSPADRSRFFSAKVMYFLRTEPYEGLVKAHASLGQVEQAFFWAENLKARLLAEAIARGEAGGAAGLSDDLREEERTLSASIAGLRKEMESLYLAKSMDLFAEKETKLGDAKKALAEFVARLRQSHPEAAAVRYPSPVKPGEVPLAGGETLLEFKVTDDKLFAFKLKGPDRVLSVRVVDMGRKDLGGAVAEYRGFFDSVRTPADLTRFDPAKGMELRSRILGDFLADVPEGASLIIVPDEALALLPFEALPVKAPGTQSFADGAHGPMPLGVEYLGDKYLISYAQSATSLAMLRSLRKGEAGAETALVVADPVFSDKAGNDPGRTALMGALKGWRGMGVAGTRGRGKPAQGQQEEPLFIRLEKTRELAGAVKELFGEGATLLTGPRATKAELLKLPLKDFRYIAFATHGILERGVPYIQEPALVLGRSGGKNLADGFLTMSEVMGLRLGAAAVALTACETGVGREAGGEGVMGMGRAFQYAGAADVLMSLWSVAEDSTVALSTEFFRQLKQGRPPKEALKLARESIRKQGWEHPFYWSAFILMGR